LKALSQRTFTYNHAVKLPSRRRRNETPFSRIIDRDLIGWTLAIVAMAAIVKSFAIYAGLELTTDAHA